MRTIIASLCAAMPNAAASVTAARAFTPSTAHEQQRQHTHRAHGQPADDQTGNDAEDQRSATAAITVAAGGRGGCRGVGEGRGRRQGCCEIVPYTNTSSVACLIFAARRQANSAAHSSTRHSPAIHKQCRLPVVTSSSHRSHTLPPSSSAAVLCAVLLLPSLACTPACTRSRGQ